MKSNSDQYPQLIINSNNKTQIRYDIEEISKNEMDGKQRISYNFNYVEIEGELTKGKIVDSIISDVHTKDAEIALINNEVNNPGTLEYIEYQTLRLHAKEIANLIMNGKIELKKLSYSNLTHSRRIKKL